MRQSLAGPAAILVLALLTGYRIWQLERIPDQGSFAKYPVIADRILAGEIPSERLADLSPGYLWLTVGLRSAGADYRTTRAIQVGMAALAALAIGALAWRLRGAVAGIAAAALILSTRSVVVNAAELEPESLILLLNAGALALAAWNPSSGWKLGAAGFLAGLSIVSRPSALLVVLILAAWLLWCRTSRRQLAAFASAAAIPPLIVLLLNASLTGTPSLMNPGTVFYEGNHPAASGYGPTIPLIVQDFESCTTEPDALHLGYRLLASRATGAPPSPALANDYWTGLALDWALDHPWQSLRLFASKLLGSSGSYEAWDLITLERKSRQLPAFGWIPFAVLLGFGVAGVFLLRDRVSLLALAILLAGLTVTTVFYVSARQRNAVIPAAALLAGLAVADAARLWREGERRRVGAAAALAVAFAAALHPLPPRAREHRYLWDRRLGGFPLAELLQSRAPLPQSLLAAVRSTPWGVEGPLAFDLAVRMIEQGDAVAALPLLASLAEAGYVPHREGEEPSSIHYQIARAQLRIGKSGEAASAARKALEEAPGDPLAGALATALEVTSDTELSESDPYTAAVSFARARVDAGRGDEAASILLQLRDELPELRCAFGRWLARTGLPPVRQKPV